MVQKKKKDEHEQELQELRRRLAEFEARERDCHKKGETLRDSESRYRRIVESAPIGMHFYDLRADGLLLFAGANRAADDILGIEHVRLIGMTIEEAFPGLIGTEIPARYYEIAKRGGFWSTDQVTYDRDDISGAFAVTAFQTAPGSMVASFTNITKRKRIEWELQKREQMLRSIIETIPYPIFLKGTDLRYSECNSAFSQFLGYPREKIISATVYDVSPKEKADIYHRADLDLLKRGGAQRYETKVRAADGTDRDIIFHKQTYNDERGKVAGMVGIMIDITDRKLAEEERRRIELQMQRTQKLESLGILAGGIAHDFNNILTAILGNLDLARMKLPAGAPVLANIESAGRSTARAADLARQMLAYAGRANITVGPIDINDLIADMLDMLKVSISKKVDLALLPAPELPAVQGDATQLRQVVMNLVINASEAFGDRPGRIEVVTMVVPCDVRCFDGMLPHEGLAPGDYVAIRIGDNGPGMDSDTVGRIFDPFFTTKFTGRGLGLAAVLGIVRGHGGGIRVESSPGLGSTFIVYLPVGRASSQSVIVPSEPARGWMGEGAILLVDDEEFIRDTAKELLELIGFTVITAASGIEAVERFSRNRDRLVGVMLDLTMPDMDGVEVLRLLRKSDPTVRVMVCSGFSESEVSRRFVDAPPAAFLEKPFQFEVLREVLRKMLAT